MKNYSVPVSSSNSCTGQHAHHNLWAQRHEDDDSASFTHTMLLQEIGSPARSHEQLLVTVIFAATMSVSCECIIIVTFIELEILDHA